jgi:iron complex outermembrane receptor protein
MFNRRLLTAAVCAALLGGGWATSVSAGEGVEEVVVTGSRIARSGFEAASPVDVITAEAMAQTGVISIDEYLKRLPTFSGWQQGAAINNGGDGGKFVDLRGLGFKRTLILINGRRQVGSFIGGSSDVGAVDLNTIPMNTVERIEVLKDGASAIYGSDALAGVVNIITKKRFEGIELGADGSWGTDEWDAETRSFSALLGAASDRGGATISLSYARQDELYQGERSWSQDALWPLLQADGSFKAQALGSSNSRRIRNREFDAATRATLTGLGLGTANFIIDDGGQARVFTSADTYNYAPINALITPHDRYQIAAEGDHELAATTMGTVNLVGEVGFTRRTSHQRLAPDASFSVTTYNGLRNAFVPASNPYNPFGDNPNNPWGISGQNVELNRRFEESGGRLFSQTNDTYRMMLGLNGDFNKAIKWELSYVFAESDNVEETNFYHRFDRWQTIVDPALCSADPSCAAAVGPDGFNPFSEFGGISAAEINYLMANSLKDQYKNRLEQILFNVSGELGALPGGAIGWAVGYENREEKASFNPDEFVGGGLTTGGAADPLFGDYSVDEFYGELLFPLLADAPFAKSLDLEASIRYSDYNTVGDTTNGSIGANWTINGEFRVRATYGTGFRAPNIVELVAGQSTTFPIVEFPCEFYDTRSDSTPNIQANCAANGAAAGPDGELGFQWQSAYTLNPQANLEPEESTTYTAGLVWTPNFFAGLRASVDYWSYEIDDYIDAPDYNGLLRNCLNAPDQSTSLACSFFDGGTGIDGGLPADAEAEFGNLGKLETSGVDLAINYRTPVDWGFISMLELDFVATYLDEYKQTFPGSGTRDLAGTAGSDDGFGVYPDWRWNSSVKVSDDAWSLEWRMRWIDEAKDLLRPADITDDAKAESILYHDLVANYSWNQFTTSLGIENITDEDPPRFHSAFNANTAPGVYDVVGRMLWMRVKVAL